MICPKCNSDLMETMYHQIEQCYFDICLSRTCGYFTTGYIGKGVPEPISFAPPEEALEQTS